MASPEADARTSEDEAFPFEGSLLDCDGHLYMEPDVMAELVGAAGSSWIIDSLREYVGTDADLAAREQARTDTWSVKGISALGSCDPVDRVDALDKMGIHRQLLFPNTVLRELRVHTPAALEACRRYNDYVIDWTRRADDRARAVCQINMGDRELGRCRAATGDRQGRPRCAVAVRGAACRNVSCLTECGTTSGGCSRHPTLPR